MFTSSDAPGAAGLGALLSAHLPSWPPSEMFNDMVFYVGIGILFCFGLFLRL